MLGSVYVFLIFWFRKLGSIRCTRRQGLESTMATPTLHTDRQTKTNRVTRSIASCLVQAKLRDFDVWVIWLRHLNIECVFLNLAQPYPSIWYSSDSAKVQASICDCDAFVVVRGSQRCVFELMCVARNQDYHLESNRTFDCKLAGIRALCTLSCKRVPFLATVS
jgi:hypothetical protein